MNSPSALLFTNEFKPGGGGVATYCYELAIALNRKYMNVTVVAAGTGDSILAFDEVQPFSIHRVKEYPLSIVRHMARAMALFKWIKIHRPDVLWAADWRSGIAVASVAQLLGLPYIVMTHGSELLIADKTRFKRFVARRIFGNAAKVLSNSHFTKRLLIDFGVNESKIMVTLLGVFPSNWKRNESQVQKVVRRHNLQDKKVILTLARLTPRKGQDMVIEALPKVLEVLPNAVYMIAGQGNDEQRLRKMVNRLHLEESVIFAGFVKEAEKSAYYHASDVYIMLSRQDGVRIEGFGLTFLEAAACGKPVIASNYGPVAEDVVVNGTTGMVINPKDVNAVAESLITLLSNQQFAAEMGEQGRERVKEKLNWDSTAKQMQEMFIALS